MKIFFFPCAVGVRCQMGEKYSLAAIDERGAKRLRFGKTKLKFFGQNIPLFRGIVYFFAGIIAFLSTFWESFKISDMQTHSISDKVSQKLNIKKESVVISVLLVVSLVIAIFLFGFLPSRLSFALIGMDMNFPLRNFLIASVKTVLFLLILLILRFLPPMQDLYKFNGACNQVRLRQGSSVRNGKWQHHAPLNILNLIVFTFLLANFVITCVGISIAWHWNLLINLSIFLACISVAYEICSICERWNWTRLVVFTDFFVSEKPNVTHDEVARIAFSEVQVGKGESLKQNEVPYSSVISEMQTILEKAGKYEKSDVEWIIATVIGKSRAEAKLVKSFSQKQCREIMKACQARAAGKPLSAIFGFVEFYGLRFDVNKKVLSPRMETEILVEEVLQEIDGKRGVEVLDLGTGSGAIAVTIAKHSSAKVTGVDISKGALQTAKQNAEKNGVKVEFVESDLFKNLKNRRKFDIIVSNPPYIRTLDIEGLDEEVKNYDPHIALDGGEDGLEFYRAIASQSPAYLKKGGKIFLEIGQGQFKDVEKILLENGFGEISSKKDYSKITRIVKAKYDKRK